MSGNIFFTSDTHYDHSNVIRFSRRPQFQEGDEVLNEAGKHVWASKEIADARVKQMNEEMLEAHNELVRPGDTVYHLGDFIYPKGRKADATKRVEWWVKQLHGHYHWVFGNHDYGPARRAEGFASKQYYKELRNIGEGKDMFVLMHYAMRVWNKRHHGAIHLYGHSHGNLPQSPNSLSWDVGVDCNDMVPVHIYEVLRRVKETKALMDVQCINWRGEDHHTNEGVD